MNKVLIIGIVVAIVILAIMAVVTQGFGLLGSSESSVEETTNSDFTVSLSEISEEANFYEYDVDGKTVEFFVVKADDGSVKTAFNECDVCYKSHKGYRQDGKYMICNNCGNRYPISGLGTENKNPGGCWPSYLANTIDGDQVIIKGSDIEEGKFRFI